MVRPVAVDTSRCEGAEHMRLLRAVIIVGSTLAFSGFAQAQGMADLHDKVRTGGKLCFSDHSHSGSSAGHSSRKSAEREAIRSWQDFTAWEYGGSWASYNMAAGKSMSCSGGGTWSCSVEARPCRGGR